MKAQIENYALGRCSTRRMLMRVSMVKPGQTTKAIEVCPPRKSLHGSSRDPLESSRRCAASLLMWGRSCASRGVVPRSVHHHCTVTRQRRVQNQHTRKTEKNREEQHAETSSRGKSGSGKQKKKDRQRDSRRRVHAVGTDGAATRRPEVTGDPTWSTTEHRKPTNKTNIESHPR